MCSNPTTKDGLTFACTRCNDCVNTRVSAWVYRAMAEKSTAKNTYLFALTYGSDTREKRDGAAVFRYSDIQKFFKRLRKAMLKADPNASLSYIVAGELGSKKGRVHWHIVVFSSFDILILGDWLSFVSKKPITKKEQKITTDPNKAKRLIWSHWPMGLLVVQEPDQGGMAYALKYALKDQFNVVKSHGTMREAKADTFGSGFFRMSKKPPIGASWLENKLNRLAELNAVLPAIKLYIPETKGFYYPSGYMREKLIDGLRAINDRSLATYGHNVPQWASLVASVQDQPKIWERFVNVEEEETSVETSLGYRNLRNARSVCQSEIRLRCGNATPCPSCVRGFPTVYLEEVVRPYVKAYFQKHGGARAAQHHAVGQRQPNPFCCLKDSPKHKRAFNKIA